MPETQVLAAVTDIPVRAESAFRWADTIREYQLEGNRLRYRMLGEQTYIDAMTQQARSQVDMEADALPAGDKRLSNDAKRSARVEQILSHMPGVAEARNTVADLHEKIAFNKVETDHAERIFKTVLAFAHQALPEILALQNALNGLMPEGGEVRG